MNILILTESLLRKSVITTQKAMFKILSMKLHAFIRGILTGISPDLSTRMKGEHFVFYLPGENLSHAHLPNWCFWRQKANEKLKL